jgi:hypothetical protein
MAKEPKKPDLALDAVLNKAWLGRTQRRNEASRTLSTLQSSLAEHGAALKSFRGRCERLPEEGRRLVRHGTSVCLGPDSMLDHLAARVIAGEDPANVASDARKSLNKYYAAFNWQPPAYSPEDLQMLKDWDFERACIMVIERAIALQKKSLEASISVQMEEFSRVVAGTRAGLARQIVGAVVALQELVEQDRRLTDGLDPEEVQLLRPKPFSPCLLSAEATKWLLDAVSTGLIRREDLGQVRLQDAQ